MKQRSPRIFIDPQKINKHLHCSICHQVFDNPSRMICGHTFCYVCIQQWAAMTKLCPLCKKSLRQRKPEKDMIAAHMIDDLMAKCVHLNCPWIGVYSTLKRHQRTCDHREKKIFENKNEQKIVNLSDDDDNNQDVIETVSINKKGKKKIKLNENDNNQLPTFQSSMDSLDMQPLVPNKRSTDPKESQQVNPQQRNSSHINNSRTSSSSSDSNYLQVNVSKLIQSKTNQVNHPQKIELQQPNQNNIEQEKQNHISSQLRDISFDEDDDMGIYPKTQAPKRDIRNNFTKKKKNFCQVNLDQPQFFKYLDENQEEPGNLYLLEKQRQQQRLKRENQENMKSGLRWGKVHASSSVSKQSRSDDSSDMENPFEESRPQKKQKIFNDIIVLDSSEESVINASKQSGELSVMNCPPQQLPTQSNYQQIYDSIHNNNMNGFKRQEDEKKWEISRQIKELTSYRPDKQIAERYRRRQGRRY